LKIGSYAKERVAREVHLRHEPLREKAPEIEKWNVRRAPRVLVVSQGYAPGLT
jgi:hypothetical protein